jgi:hypothetical protein
MVRLLLILATFAVVLCGCDQASTPVEKQEKEHGAEQVAPKPVTEVQAVTEPPCPNPRSSLSPPRLPQTLLAACPASKQRWRRSTAVW